MNWDRKNAHEEVQHKSPRKILAKLKTPEAEIAKDLEELERILG